MKKGRLEAFSDGVIAVLITIMVLDLHAPIGDHIHDLLPLWPKFLAYILSFVFIGIYWNNHHHMLYATEKVNGTALWLNLNLLFWLSLIPFVTDWVGESRFFQWPVILYGFVLLMCGVSYTILCAVLIRQAGPDSVLAEALGGDWKGKLSLVIYCVAIVVAFFSPCIAFVLYGVVACMWFIPDRRIEKKISEGGGGGD